MLAPDGQFFHYVRLQNKSGMILTFMDWGATWLSCRIPTDAGLQEVLLGCRLQDYPTQQAYLGAVIGRYANRIANAQFYLNGQVFTLNANQGQHQLHGGEGFNQRRWDIVAQGEKCGRYFVRFALFSPDGDQGFPGNVQAAVTYSLTDDNEVEIEFEALSDQTTPLNLTNHAYFNLDNADNGDLIGHQLQLSADYYLPVNHEGIPIGGLESVDLSCFDFRQMALIAPKCDQALKVTKGYDHCFLLNHHNIQRDPVAILQSQKSRLMMKVWTNQPALQVYTGNYLAGTPSRLGKYDDFAGIALETQVLPDTPNHSEWQQWGGISQANVPYYHWTKFGFCPMDKK